MTEACKKMVKHVITTLQLAQIYSITNTLILTCTVQWRLCHLPLLGNKVRHEQKDWNASSHTCTHIHHYDNLNIIITSISLQGKQWIQNNQHYIIAWQYLHTEHHLSWYLPLVLLHKVQIVPSDSDCPCHLGAVNCSS